MNRDVAQDLVDAAEGDEDLLDGDASEETGFQGDVGDVGGFVQPGLRDDVVGLLQLVVDVELEGGGGVGRFGSDEEGVVIRVWVLGTGVEGEVEAWFVTHGFVGFWRWDGKGRMQGEWKYGVELKDKPWSPTF